MFGTLIGIAIAILDIFAINDILRSSRDTASKVVLIAIILLFPVLGAGLYLFAFRQKEMYR